MHTAPAKSNAAQPYSALACGYDRVMAHVEYDLWAAYVYGLIREFYPEATSVLELGCGTGSFALEMQPRGPFDYLATDRSADMVRVAREKAAARRVPVTFEEAEFLTFNVPARFDLVLLLYDGLNYLLDPDQVCKLFLRALDALKPGGVFIFDQSTPANSVNNEALFEDQDKSDDFSYVRRSRYDASTRMHTTTFDITVGTESFFEEHLQRAYDLSEIRDLLEQAGFVILAAYSDFTTAPADLQSERIHWVVKKPA